MWAFIFSLPLITRYSFGILGVMALLFGSFAFWKKGKEEHYDEHDLIDLTLITLLWSLLGSRLVYILLHFSDFGLNILYWFSIWSKPGFHWVGLFGGGTLAFVRYCHSHKWNYFKVFDLAVIGIALSQGLLNLGIFLSASGLGKATSMPFGVVFPGSFEKRHAIGLYAFILWLGVFFLLWWLEGKYRRFVWYQKFKGDALPGFLSFVYIIAFGLIGALTATFSEVSTIYYGINIDLVIRLILVIVGVVGIFVRSGLVAKLGLDKFSLKLGKK